MSAKALKGALLLTCLKIDSSKHAKTSTKQHRQKSPEKVQYSSD
jgi:hypothetical protein